MRQQRGFSMIDLMVGLFVGLLVSLAVYGTASVVGAQRRTSVSGNGAMESGMAAVYAIQHDIKSAGIGVWANGQTICSSINIYHSGTIANGTSLAPVVITPGSSASVSDQITVAYSDWVLANNAIELTSGMSSAVDAITVGNARAFTVNDFVIVGDASTTLPCTLMQVTGKSTAGFGFDVAHAAGAWNPANPGTAFTTPATYMAGADAFDLGPPLADGSPRLNWTTWRINGNNLEALNLLTSTADVIANDIVMIKAYYGTSNGSAQQIEQWVAATDAWASPLDATHISAIRAIRLAIVARSPVAEKPSVIGGSCDATTTAPTSWADGPTLDLSANTSWQCYRYRVFTIVAPLKNVLFGAGGV